MMVLGLDPGYGRVGVGIVQIRGPKFALIHSQCIETSARMPFPQRLCQIYSSISELIDQFKPQEMAIEKLYFAKNTTTAIDVSQARGIMLLAGAQKNIPIAEYTPLEIKMALTGYGRADKDQIKYMIRVFLGPQSIHKLDDVNDALAVAICHFNSRKNIKLAKC